MHSCLLLPIIPPTIIIICVVLLLLLLLIIIILARLIYSSSSSCCWYYCSSASPSSSHTYCYSSFFLHRLLLLFPYSSASASSIPIIRLPLLLSRVRLLLFILFILVSLVDGFLSFFAFLYCSSYYLSIRINRVLIPLMSLLIVSLFGSSSYHYGDDILPRLLQLILHSLSSSAFASS